MGGTRHAGEGADNAKCTSSWRGLHSFRIPKWVVCVWAYRRSRRIRARFQKACWSVRRTARHGKTRSISGICQDDSYNASPTGRHCPPGHSWANRARNCRCRRETDLEKTNSSSPLLTSFQRITTKLIIVYRRAPFTVDLQDVSVFHRRAECKQAVGRLRDSQEKHRPSICLLQSLCLSNAFVSHSI